MHTSKVTAWRLLQGGAEPLADAGGMRSANAATTEEVDWIKRVRDAEPSPRSCARIELHLKSLSISRECAVLGLARKVAAAVERLALVLNRKRLMRSGPRRAGQRGQRPKTGFTRICCGFWRWCVPTMYDVATSRTSR